MTEVGEADALLAVVAHGLLNAAYPALMAAQTLQRHDVPADMREELLRIVVERSGVVVDTLHDLVQGLPPELLEAHESISSSARGGGI